MNSERSLTYESPYKLLLIRTVAALLGAHFLVSFGEEYHLFELLLDTEYYTSLAGSFVIAFILLTIVHVFSRKLDSKYDWLSRPYKRGILQIVFGLFLPSIFAYILAAAYFWTHGIFILDTVYLRYDFPVVVILLGVVNILYVMEYIFRKSKDIINSGASEKPDFLVHKAGKNFLLAVETIAYFYHQEGNNYVKTRDGEQYLISQTLDQLQIQLSECGFFRANRQVIVNRLACDCFETIENGKLQLFVQPDYPNKIVISQKRTKRFREWMEA